MKIIDGSTLGACELLTPKELAAFLKVPVGTIYQWVFRRQVPHLKIGRHLRFDKAQVILHFTEKTENERPALLPEHSLVNFNRYCSLTSSGSAGVAPSKTE